MIRVIILRGTVGPDGPLAPGDDVSLDDRSARLLVSIGKARLAVAGEIEHRDPAAAHRDPESATKAARR